MINNKISKLIFILISFCIFVALIYSIFIFFTFAQLGGISTFKVMLSIVLAFYILVCIALYILRKKNQKKLVLIILIVLFAIQISGFFVLKDIYYISFKPTNNNYLVRDNASERPFRDSEVYIDNYLKDSKLYLSDYYLFNIKDNKYIEYSAYECEFILDSSIDRVISIDKAQEMINSDEYYSFNYIFLDTTEKNTQVTFYCGDEYKDCSEFVLYADMQNNLYFLPKDFEDRGALDE